MYYVEYKALCKYYLHGNYPSLGLPVLFRLSSIMFLMTDLSTVGFRLTSKTQLGDARVGV